MLSLGSTLLFFTPPNYQVKHLYIIAALEESSKKTLIVNVTSFKQGCDGSCILRFGEHKFIEPGHNSIINYGDAKILTIPFLEDLLQRKLAEIHEPVTHRLLVKIQKAGLSSPALAGKYRDFLSANNILPK